MDFRPAWALPDMASSRRATRRALLVVDMSVEQTANLSRKACQRTISSIQALAKSGAFSFLADCRLWISDSGSTSLSSVNPGVGIANTGGAALVPDLCGQGLEFIPKTNYSAFYSSALEAKLREEGVTHVFVAGINTDFCVFATALDAYYRQFQTFVVEDAASSVCGSAGHEEGLQRARAHFGNGCVVSCKSILGAS